MYHFSRISETDFDVIVVEDLENFMRSGIEGIAICRDHDYQVISLDGETISAFLERHETRLKRRHFLAGTSESVRSSESSETSMSGCGIVSSSLASSSGGIMMVGFSPLRSSGGVVMIGAEVGISFVYALTDPSSSLDDGSLWL